MNEDRFAPKIEGIEKDDAEKIVEYKKAQKQMKKLLETEAGSNSIQEEIKNLNPFKLDPADKVIDRYDIEKVDGLVTKSQNKELVEKLTIGLEKEKRELRKKEIANLILKLKNEIEGIENKLKDYENEDLNEEIKKILEKDRKETEKLEAEIKNLEDELRELE